MRVRYLYCVFFACCLGSIIHPLRLYAQVNVNNVIYTFSSKGRPVQNIVVNNASASPVYVSVKTEAMLDYTKKPIVVGTTEDILVSPKNFSIEGNGQRTVRMLLKNPPSDVERGYRVYFIPQPGDFEGTTITRTEQGRTAVIKVATGVGVLVFVDPKETKIEFKDERDPLGITFTNTGNIQVYLGDGKACPTGVSFPPIGASSDNPTIGKDAAHPDEKGCYSIPSQRVYPGTTFRVEVPHTMQVRYLKHIGSDGKFESYVAPAMSTP